MKTVLFSIFVFFAFISTTNANTTETINVIDNCVNTNQVAVKKINLEIISTFISPLPKTITDQILYCAQVQMDIKETYTPIFGPDRANQIALGAFMGCMGYL